MSTTRTENSSEMLQSNGVLVEPHPLRVNLSSSEDIRREMAKVYREARSGRLAIGDATKFSYILTQILRAYEMTVIEGRLEALEGNS